MTQVETANPVSHVRHPFWEAALVACLGLTLLGAGWLDVRTYLTHRGKPTPDFSFLASQGGERLMNVELHRSPDSFAMLENIGPVEIRAKPYKRQGIGPASTIWLTTNHLRALLSVEFDNGVPDQDITLRCNDAVIEPFPHQPTGIVRRKYMLPLRAGLNTISFGFARYNPGGTDLATLAPQTLAGCEFRKLDLTLN